MLSRRNARIKALQTLYANETSERSLEGDVNLILEKAFKRTENSFIFNLLILLEVLDQAYHDADTKKAKLRPTEDDQFFLTPLCELELVQLIQQSKWYNQLVKKPKLRPLLDKSILKRLFKKLAQSSRVRKFLQSGDFSNSASVNILVYINRRILHGTDDFHKMMEENFQEWNDDNEPVLFSLNQLLEDIAKTGEFSSFGEMEEKLIDNRNFSIKLTRDCLDQYDALADLIRPKLVNWEMDRIAKLDLIIMKLALTEILSFPTVPVKVSINEFIDISKKYSTPKSKEFVNGILDALMKELKAAGRIQKSGRGLME